MIREAKVRDIPAIAELGYESLCVNDPYPELRVDRYLRFCGGIRGIGGDALETAIAAAADRFSLADVLARVRSAGYSVGNVDVIIHAERPKLGEHKPRIKASLAELLELSPDAIGVKATTGEGLGAIGRGEAIACWATVLLTAP